MFSMFKVSVNTDLGVRSLYANFSCGMALVVSGSPDSRYRVDSPRSYRWIFRQSRSTQVSTKV